MAKPKKSEPGINSNAWITTYTDLMTLLLTFFVLLLSLSIMDSRKQRIALNSLTGAFGFKSGAHSVIGTKEGLNITVGSAPITKEQVDFERLQNIAFKNGLEADVEIKREREKIILSLGHRVVFNHGSSEMKQDSFKFLSDLASVLRDVPGPVELRGYADQTETVLESEPFKAAMYLSTRRAFTVYRYLSDEEKIPARKIVAHGFGNETPRNPKEGVGHDFNRQVEIICDYQSKIPHNLRKRPSKRNILLDFKGFLFDLKEDQHE
jgi:chemotaxis protein MotB